MAEAAQGEWREGREKSGGMNVRGGEWRDGCEGRRVEGWM